MKRQSMVIWVFIAVIIAASVSQAEPEEQSAEQFKQIEQYIDQLHQQVENHYAGRLFEIQLKTDEQIKLLEVADKGIYSSLAEQTEIAQTVLQINGFEDFPFGHFAPDESIDNILNSHFHETVKIAPRFFAIEQSRIAEAKNYELSSYEWSALQAEREKEYALTVRLPELEEKLKDNALSPKPEPTHGVITAIVHSRKKPAAIINGRLVHEKDAIDGVRLVKIYPDKIKFQKKGKSWDQKVQEPPKKYW